MSKSSGPCKECGQAWSAHHTFVAAPVPQGCRCEPEDWYDWTEIPAICADFVEDSTGVCTTCHHEAGCHETIKRGT